MDLGIRGKKALVTGGTRGIGRAAALMLAQEGCDVAVAARGVDLPLQEALRAHGVEAYSLSWDALELQGAALMIGWIRERWAQIDILVNNVGGGGRGGQNFDNTPDRVWEEVMTKNFWAARDCTRLVLPMMKEQCWGRIVTVSSMHGREGAPNVKPWFMAAKAAEIALMKAMAQDETLHTFGITFNTVAPGYILAGANYPPLSQSPHRVGTPEDVASLVTFLCSKQARFINGACMAIDGGEGRAL